MKLTFLFVIILLLQSSSSAGQFSMQAGNMSVENSTDRNSNQNKTPTISLVEYQRASSNGISPALLIVAGIGAAIGGAVLSANGSFAGPLLMTGGIGMVSTGIVVAVHNTKNNEFTGISVAYLF